MPPFPNVKPASGQGFTPVGAAIGTPVVLCPILTLVAQNVVGTQDNDITENIITSTNDVPISTGNQAIFVSTESFTNNTDVVHMEMVYEDEAQANAQNVIGIIPSIAQPFTGFGDAICIVSISPNIGSPNTGVVFDALSASPLFTNQTIVSEAVAGDGNGWVCSLDLDMVNETCNYKDSEGNSSAMTMANPGFNANPVHLGWFDGCGDLENDSIALEFNGGSLDDRLPTIGSVRQCNA